MIEKQNRVIFNNNVEKEQGHGILFVHVLGNYLAFMVSWTVSNVMTVQSWW